MAKNKKRASGPDNAPLSNKRSKVERDDNHLPPLTDLKQSVAVYFNNRYFFENEVFQDNFMAAISSRNTETQLVLKESLEAFFQKAHDRENVNGNVVATTFLMNTIHGCRGDRVYEAYARWKEENDIGNKDNDGDLPRMVSVGFQIKDTELSHTYDLRCFSTHVNGLFNMYCDDTERKRLLGPYFCFVQSSGMGKTKLLYEYKRIASSTTFHDPVHSFLIVPKAAIKNHSAETMEVFDFILDLELPYFNEGKSPLEMAKAAARITFRKLHAMLTQLMGNKKHRNANAKCERILLMFDESQKLLGEKFGYKAFHFRCIRLWLREIPVGYRKDFAIVAVFTGTNSKLTNFHIESDEDLKKPSAPDSSRHWADRANYYPTGSHVYAPFFQTTTMGSCLSLMETPESEYARAVFYGRPLFALMATTNELEEKIATILLRMLHRVDWMDLRETWVNILATRVQLGQTTAEMASRLVANKYANFCGFNDDTKAVLLGYFSDPVCARLAMCMMDETFAMDDTNGLGPIGGQKKKWWTKKLREIFSTGLVSPDKGDFGEVVVALYMLFCGDLLRKRINEDNVKKGNEIPLYSQFSVSLEAWLHLMLCGGNLPVPSIEDCKVSVGFIQVCRNPLRSYCGSWKCFKDESFLKYIYEAGIAFYTCNNCAVIDMVVPLRIKSEVEGNIDGFVYAPLLVSVKCHGNFSQRKAEKECKKMTKKADKVLEKGLCLLIVFGSEETATPFIGDVALTQNEDISDNLMKGVVAKAIRVPTKDKFGLAKAFNAMVSTTQVEAELFACHTFVKAHGPDATDLTPEKALRNKSLQKFAAKYKDLRAAMTESGN